MKQSNSRKNRESTAALYVRLSRDDGLDVDSNSIQTQKKLLKNVAKEKGYTNLLTFEDDGVSGVTMNRPGFLEMKRELEKGYISAVFVKDLSRLGRNYIEVGRLTEEFFPSYDIRLVAVSDGVDTDEGENDLNPIRNLFNEWYSRDISKKRRISNKVKGNSGEPLSLPPYGYMKDPDNPKRWIIDKEAAVIVRRIFDMTLSGYGSEQIATALDNDGILTPMNYWVSKGMPRGGLRNDVDHTHWKSSTIIKMLSFQEYCGDVINFKTYSKSYKLKQRIPNDVENMAIFKDVHEPVIDRDTWEKVQAKRGKVRKRVTSNGEKNMFSGLLRCADCGSNMNYHFNQKNHDITYFNCTNNNNTRKTCSTTHYIRVDFLEQVVLGEIRRLTKFASQYESEFAKVVMGHSKQNVEQDRKELQKELRTLQARDRELDVLFERLYEDNVASKIDDDRFAKMSKKYTLEQGELQARIKVFKAELEKQSDKTTTIEMFIASVRKYTRAKKLTERMLSELIERIEVHHAEKVDGVNIQRLVIHYNCVGVIEIPDLERLPDVDVQIQTRKGVAVSYSAPKLAI